MATYKKVWNEKTGQNDIMTYIYKPGTAGSWQPLTTANSNPITGDITSDPWETKAKTYQTQLNQLQALLPKLNEADQNNNDPNYWWSQTLKSQLAATNRQQDLMKQFENPLLGMNSTVAGLMPKLYKALSQSYGNDMSTMPGAQPAPNLSGYNLPNTPNIPGGYTPDASMLSRMLDIPDPSQIYQDVSSSYNTLLGNQYRGNEARTMAGQNADLVRRGISNPNVNSSRLRDADLANIEAQSKLMGYQAAQPYYNMYNSAAGQVAGMQRQSSEDTLNRLLQGYGLDYQRSVDMTGLNNQVAGQQYDMSRQSMQDLLSNWLIQQGLGRQEVTDKQQALTTLMDYMQRERSALGGFTGLGTGGGYMDLAREFGNMSNAQRQEQALAQQQKQNSTNNWLQTAGILAGFFL